MKKILQFLVNEYLVITVILLNTTALILDGFPAIHAQYGDMLHQFDVYCMLYYVFEVFVKTGILGFRGYWRSAWNRFDFIIVLLGLPLLVDPFIEGEFKGAEIVLLLRMGRFLRFFRMLRFIFVTTRGLSWGFHHLFSEDHFNWLSLEIVCTLLHILLLWHL